MAPHAPRRRLPLRAMVTPWAAALLALLALLPLQGGRRRGPGRPHRPPGLTTRHNVTLTRLDSGIAAVGGNGEFAFTMDVTGCRRSPNLYDQTIRSARCRTGAGTRGRTRRLDIDRFEFKTFDSHGRHGRYADIPANARTERGQPALARILTACNLGRIASA